MKGFVQDIESLAVRNVDFRQVLYTAKHCQLVVMALKPEGRDRLGSPQARPVLSRRGRDRRSGPRRRPDGDQRGLCDRRAGRCDAQHHQYRQHAAEAVYALRAAESSRRRSPPHACGSGGGHGALRRQDVGIAGRGHDTRTTRGAREYVNRHLSGSRFVAFGAIAANRAIAIDEIRRRVGHRELRDAVPKESTQPWTPVTASCCWSA